MSVKVIPITDVYRENWERVFGEKDFPKPERLDSYCDCMAPDGEYVESYRDGET